MAHALCEDSLTGRRRHIPRPVEEQVPIPTDLAPPLIEAALLDAVQQRFDLNRR